jgi:pimeloyl-ACP methyl ester carboxylesterase
MAVVRVFAFLLLLSTANLTTAQIALPVPDGCTLTTHNGQLSETSIPGIGSAMRVFAEQSVLAALPGPADLVVIVNGNSYSVSNYYGFARHLARNGFIVAVVGRANNGLDTNATVVRDAVDAAFVTLGLGNGTRVALVGHSVGGRVVVDAARRNRTEQWGIPLHAVIGVAPNIEHAPHLTGEMSPAYLLLYGSQDQDMLGTGPVVREAFAAYDRSSTESSTTCSTPPCLSTQPQMDRTMIYVHGANHNSFLGAVRLGTEEFISHADQFCIGKAYVNSFLRWRLRNQLAHKPILRATQTPPSVAAITSYRTDYKGNPAGTPLRMQFQVSPVQRQDVQNFQSGQLGIHSTSPSVAVQFHENGTLAGSPWLVRHATRAARIHWPTAGGTQFAAFSVASARRDTRNFSHAALRIGQLWGAPGITANGSKSLYLGLYDGTRWQWQRFDVPPVDLKPHGIGISAMGTVSIPLHRYNTLNRATIQRVGLLFPAGTTGSVMVDSLEWFRD